MIQLKEPLITDTLECLDENIFIIDLEYRVAWMNQSAQTFIENIKTYLKLEKAEDLIGTSISRFHKNPSYQEKLLEKGEFPIVTKLNLFNRFVAKLIVKALIVRGEKLGYLLTWRDVTEIEKEKEKKQALIDELSTPVLPTIAEHTLLVPLIGELSIERMERLTTKLLNECLNHSAEYVLLDFSGVTTLVDSDIGQEVEKLASSVELMGAAVLYSGFSPEMVKAMVDYNIKTDQLSFVSFRSAMRYVVSKLGYRLENGTVL